MFGMYLNCPGDGLLSLPGFGPVELNRHAPLDSSSGLVFYDYVFQLAPS